MAVSGRQALTPSRWDLDPRSLPPGEELVGVGADLTPSTIVGAYGCGTFPMPMGTGRRAALGWWSPDPRGILPIDQVRITRSLRASARRFTISIDAAFEDVIGACADPRRPGGWITGAIRVAYLDLHRAGYAHSVEAWDAAGRLAGGLYGVALGGLFAGESMFHRERDASKVALLGLVEIIAATDDAADRLIDVQWRTDHLATLGSVSIPRADYLERLSRALALAEPPALCGSSAQRDHESGVRSTV